MSNGNKNTGWWIVGAILLFIFQVSLIANVVFLGLIFGLSSLESGKTFEETTVEGRYISGKKVVIIDLLGVISYGVPGAVENSMVDDLITELRQARKDKNIGAVVLNVDSPGGEITASDALYHEIKKCDEKKPVVVYINSLGASGAYYASMGSRYIMSNELSITGSIGVILQTINYEKLADWIGIKTITFKSGKMKDLLNPARPMTPEEKTYVQGMINESYDRFVEIVSKRRNLDEKKLRDTIADGRIISGKDALSDGLIDGTGYLKDAIDQARTLGGLKSNSRVVRYAAPFRVGQLFRLFGNTSGNKLKIDIVPESLKLEAGKLYYISPHVFDKF